MTAAAAAAAVVVVVVKANVLEPDRLGQGEVLDLLRVLRGEVADVHPRRRRPRVRPEQLDVLYVEPKLGPVQELAF
jgi:hypothetical protein